MKINNCLFNTYECPDFFLRRMVSFCCKELDLPVNYIKEVAFYNTRKSHRARILNGARVFHPCFSGRAYLGKKTISVRVSPDAKSFPCRTRRHQGGLQERLADRVEALVYVTAHEVAHHEQKKRTRNGGDEAPTDRFAFQVLRTFREDREALLIEWSTNAPKPRAKKSTSTTVEKREKNARDLLDKWERKLKLAKTKVAKYRKKATYYDRQKIAAIKTS